MRFGSLGMGAESWVPKARGRKLGIIVWAWGILRFGVGIWVGVGVEVGVCRWGLRFGNGVTEWVEESENLKALTGPGKCMIGIR